MMNNCKVAHLSEMARLSCRGRCHDTISGMSTDRDDDDNEDNCCCCGGEDDDEEKEEGDDDTVDVDSA